MDRSTYKLPCMADLAAEADHQAAHLAKIAQRTRDLIVQSHQLLATQAAEQAMGQQLERDAADERAAARLG